ncbi:Uncharacterised protein [uncultured archaeon]|nr:Uncharacterised protein [uncultured archaeon]
MYHPGKVIAVLSPKDKGILSADSTVQATLRMWDENVLTMQVAPKLASKIKEGDIVLADYRPQSGLSVPVPRNTIVKILRGRAADRMWQEYREVYDKRKKSEGKEAPAHQSYIG